MHSRSAKSLLTLTKTASARRAAKKPPTPRAGARPAFRASLGHARIARLPRTSRPRSPAAAGSAPSPEDDPPRRRHRPGRRPARDRRPHPRPPRRRPAEAQAHLAPSLRDLMPDPSSLARHGLGRRPLLAGGQGPRADRRLRRLRRRRRRLRRADPDLAAPAWATTATLYVPDRIDEGYGPNVPAMQALGAAPRPHRLRRLRHASATSPSPPPAAT